MNIIVHGNLLLHKLISWSEYTISFYVTH